LKPQAVLDTNVIVAGLGSALGASWEIMQLFGERTIDVHVSVPVLFQYEDVLTRVRRKPRLDPDAVATTLVLFGRLAIRHDIFFLWRDVISDPNDASFLELAVTARVEFIVTHNTRHFRGCEVFGVRAIKPIEFLRLVWR
jgi:putative PIN family toxin of toxin-antitoxin system